MSDIPGIDVGPVTAWLETNVAGAAGPFRFDVIAGGHSNLTFRVTGASGPQLVLRRPPLGHVLASAHDMGREHRILSALQGTAVPVPPVEGFCDDLAVNGAPFYVMRFVDGHVLRDRETAEHTLSETARGNASRSIVDTMAAIHAVDLDAAGLDQLGRHEGYIERQLKRWYGQWNQGKTRELAAVDRVYEGLLARIPEQGPATIVHGDYRLDNCILADDGSVAAVLDWELCTLGDPLADLGLLCVYWADPGEPTHSGMPAATTVEGFPTKSELVQRYAELSGRDVSQIGYYVAFGYWKLACIIQGVYARYSAGAMGDRGDVTEFDVFGRQVEMLADAAERALDTIG